MTKFLTQAFRDAGKSLYMVGGSVRDTILGRQVKDWDYTTDAMPDEIKVLLNEAGASAVFAIGEKFGTIGAKFGDTDVEITTFRHEEYQEGSRKPDVALGGTIESDLARRDFTINAIAIDCMTGETIDPFNGEQDILRGIIKAVQYPDVRFKEDPLRLLRAVRFTAQLGFIIDPPTMRAIGRQSHMLSIISKERIRDEMTKILVSDRASAGIELLVNLDLMQYIMPEFQTLADMPLDGRHKNNYLHTLKVIDQMPATVEGRWAALLHDIAKPQTKTVSGRTVHFLNHEVVGAKMTKKILRGLHFENEVVNAVVRLVELHMRVNGYAADWTDGAIRRFMIEAGDSLDMLLDLSEADLTTKNQAKRTRILILIRDLRLRIQDIQERDAIVPINSPLNGNDLMALFGRPAGAWIKTIKDALLEAVIDDRLDPTDIEGAKALAFKLMETL